MHCVSTQATSSYAVTGACDVHVETPNLGVSTQATFMLRRNALRLNAGDIHAETQCIASLRRRCHVETQCIASLTQATSLRIRITGIKQKGMACSKYNPVRGCMSIEKRATLPHNPVRGCTPVLPNLQFGSGEYEHLQCEKKRQLFLLYPV
jgi:hypothetical protein